MEIYNRCSVNILYFDDEPACDDECIVRVSEGTIEVAYDDDEGPVCYRGRNAGDGHFQLAAPERDGKATLHQLPGAQILEGYWEEGGNRGMWRIFLSKPKSVPSFA